MYQFSNQILDIPTHITGLAVLGGVGLDERHPYETCDVLDQIGLTDSRGTNQDDVLLLVIPAVLLSSTTLDVVVMITDSRGKHLLGIVLLDHIAIQVGFDLTRFVVKPKGLAAPLCCFVNFIGLLLLSLGKDLHLDARSILILKELLQLVRIEFLVKCHFVLFLPYSNSKIPFLQMQARAGAARACVPSCCRAVRDFICRNSCPSAACGGSGSSLRKVPFDPRQPSWPQHAPQNASPGMTVLTASWCRQNLKASWGRVGTSSPKSLVNSWTRSRTWRFRSPLK